MNFIRHHLPRPTQGEGLSLLLYAAASALLPYAAAIVLLLVGQP